MIQPSDCWETNTTYPLAHNILYYQVLPVQHDTDVQRRKYFKRIPSAFLSFQHPPITHDLGKCMFFLGGGHGAPAAVVLRCASATRRLRHPKPAPPPRSPFLFHNRLCHISGTQSQCPCDEGQNLFIFASAPCTLPLPLTCVPIHPRCWN